MKEKSPTIIKTICNACFGLRIRYSKAIARLIKCTKCGGTGKAS